MAAKEPKGILRHACAGILAAELLIPVLTLVGNMTGRELFLAFPQAEHEVRAAVVALLAAGAVYARREMTPGGRACATVCPLAAIVCGVLSQIPLNHIDPRVFWAGDAGCVLIECAAAFVVLFCCGNSAWKAVTAVLSFLLLPTLLLILLFSALMVDFGAKQISDEVLSADGRRSAVMIAHDEGALGGSVCLEVRESGAGVPVLIGRLRSVSCFQNGTASYDWAADRFSSLEWLDDNTLLIGGKTFSLKRGAEGPAFTEWVEVVVQDAEGKKEYYRVEGTPGGIRRRTECDPFEGEAIEFYRADSSAAFVEFPEDKQEDWVWCAENWVGSVVRLEKDGQLVEADGTMRKLLNRLQKEAEHWIMDVRIIRAGGAYFVRTRLNVNLWTPVELFWYDPAEDALTEIAVFDDAEIVGLRLKDGFGHRPEKK